MTLGQFIQTYTGQRVRGGQCGNLVRQYWIDVDRTTPPSYENSKDYWFNDFPGYERVSKPQPGDIAIYNGHGAYVEGHSAIYVDGRVFEQNADPDGSPAHLFNRSNTYLLGYLRKQGEVMPGIKIVGAPASIGSADKRIDVFVRGSDDGLWQKWFDASGWHDWVKVGSGVASSPSISSPYDGRLDVFFTGIGGDLVHTWFEGDWHPNESLGQIK